jgi:hypothetical protein
MNVAYVLKLSGGEYLVALARQAATFRKGILVEGEGQEREAAA